MLNTENTMAERPTLPYFALAELLPAPLPTSGLVATTQSSIDFIVMEYIPGETLGHAWPRLSTAEREAIVSQLREHLDELRSIPPPDYYGGIWRQPIRDRQFVDPNNQGYPHPDKTIVQPHATEEEWVEAMWRIIDLLGHAAVFTHANLFPGNIMLREDGSPVIIDWENSGWYPSFWEYCCAIMISMGESSDWAEWIHKFLDEYVAELPWLGRHHDIVVLHRCMY
ncbi:hypothetical protein VTK26DRAFT_5719 [Humicola hyalothermophila]